MKNKKTAKSNDEHLPIDSPGYFLYTEFMEPYKITKYRLAKDTGMTASRVGEIISGDRAITPDTAERLARYFGTSAQMWINLQADYERRVHARSTQPNRILQFISTFIVLFAIMWIGHYRYAHRSPNFTEILILGIGAVSGSALATALSANQAKQSEKRLSERLASGVQVPEISSTVRDYIISGQKIQAIRAYSQTNAVGLKEAKHAVELASASMRNEGNLS